MITFPSRSLVLTEQKPPQYLAGLILISGFWTDGEICLYISVLLGAQAKIPVTLLF